MGRIFHSTMSPQERLKKSHELLRWAEGVLKKPRLHPKTREQFERVVTLARKSIRIRRVAMRMSIRAVK